MADGYKVGNLEIAFKAVDKTSTSFAKLAKNLEAIKQAIGDIGNADLSPFIANIKSVRKVLTPMLKNISGASEGIIALNQSIQKIGVNKLSKVSQDLANINKTTDEAANSAKQLTVSISSGTKALQNQSTQTKEVKKSIEELIIEEYKAQQEATKKRIEYLQASLALGKAGADTYKYRKELAKLTNQQNKATKGSNKFIKSIGRIAFYRTIRRAIQLITQSVNESINTFAMLDDNVNKTMSEFTSSLKIIQLSTGTLLLPILQAISPILQQIAVAFANFANIISQAMATGDKYWAINAEAIQDYRKQLDGATAGFDKFNVLSGGNNNTEFFEEKEVDKENEAVQKTQKIIQEIKTALQGVGYVLEFVGNNLNIIAGIIAGIIAFQIVTKILNFIQVIGGLNSALSILATHPIIAIIAAVLAVVLLLYATNEDFRNSVNDLFKTLQPVVSLLSKLLSQILKPLGNLLTLLIDYIIAPLATFYIKKVTEGINYVMVALIPFAYALEFIFKILQSIYYIGRDLITLKWGDIGSDLDGVWSKWSSKDFAKQAKANLTEALADQNGSIDLSDSSTNFGDFGASAITSLSSKQYAQIDTTSIKSAFYQTLVEWSKSSSDNNINLTVNLDGEVIYKNVTSHAQQRGNKWA